MKQFLKQTTKVTILFMIVLSVFSCKTDEFKVKDLTLKEDWSFPLISPMLTGEMEFKDLIYDWDDPLAVTPGEKITVLKYPSGKAKQIPTRIIFEPSAVIDSFYFLINGQYEFLRVEFKYIVSNGSPFPLNFQMEFFDRSTPANLGPAILPPPFDGGDFSGPVPVALKSEYTVLLNDAQLKSFIEGDRIKITAWYNKTSYIDSRDTLKSNYPIDISVILNGEVKLVNK